MLNIGHPTAPSSASIGETRLNAPQRSAAVTSPAADVFDSGHQGGLSTAPSVSHLAPSHLRARAARFLGIGAARSDIEAQNAGSRGCSLGCKIGFGVVTLVIVVAAATAGGLVAARHHGSPQGAAATSSITRGGPTLIVATPAASSTANLSATTFSSLPTNPVTHVSVSVSTSQATMQLSPTSTSGPSSEFSTTSSLAASTKQTQAAEPTPSTSSHVIPAATSSAAAASLSSASTSPTMTSTMSSPASTTPPPAAPTLKSTSTAVSTIPSALPVAPGGFKDSFVTIDAQRWSISDNYALGDTFQCGFTKDNILANAPGLQMTVANGAHSDKQYGCAQISTQDTYVFGTFSVLMQASSQPGVVTSAFTYAENAAGSPQEIDMEITGGNLNILSANAWRDGVSTAQAITLPFDASKEPHVYAVDWRSDHLAWFVDGVEMHRITANLPQPIPAKFYANTWLSIPDGWSGTYNPGEKIDTTSHYGWMAYAP